MKRKSRLLSLLLVLTMLLAFVPAGVQAAEEAPYDLRVLTFEDADYKGGTNFAGGSDWTSLIDDPQYGGKLLYGDGGGVSTLEEAYTWTDTGNTELQNTLSEGYGTWCYWSGGHAVSNYNSGEIANYGGFNTQLTVYKKGVEGLARTGGGHNGSGNFAVHYGYADNSGYGLGEDALPALTFADGAERVIDHMYVTNTTYALNCYIDGNGLTAKIGEDDWVKLVATGYDAAGKKTGETGLYLCNGPDDIVMDWTKWDLSVLGKVQKVTFNVTGSSDNGYGFSQPAYFAYDDVAVRFEKPVPATDIALSASELALTVGETASLTATVTPENTTETVVWTSSNDAVASVENGTVTARKAGSATIRAACGSVKAECTVTVAALPLSVSAGDTAAAVTKLGDTQYRAVLPYGSAATIEVADASFLMVTDAHYGYINEEGVNPFTLTAEQLEALLLTDTKSVPFTPAEYSKVAYMSIMDAMAGNTYDLYLELTREAVAATGITLDPNALTLKPNETAKLTAVVQPENTTDTLRWETSDDTVATVKDGTVTAVKAGSAVIAAICGSARAECTVTVEKPTPVSGVTLDKTSMTLFPEETAKLTASVAPADATDKSITWESSAADVASVNGGVVTAKTAGETVITVKTTDGSFTAECTVTVKTAVEPAQEGGVYQIGTPEELVWFAKKVNGGEKSLAAVLTKDIDLTGINWTPIGSDDSPFAGRFDGSGHAVRNLRIDYAAGASGERIYLGLFGCVAGTKDARAVIKNFTVSGSVTAASGYSVYSGNLAGVVADGKYLDLSGIVSRVAVRADENVGKACGVGGFAGTLVNSTVTDCGSEGSVSGVKNIGGFCYELYAGTMTGCYNTGSVTASGTYVGGIMGYAKNATITNVYNRGAVSTAKNMIGGLVGVMENSAVTNAYTTGTVTVAETGGAAVGAAVGWAGTVSNVYYLEGTAEKGIGRADNEDAAAEAKTAEELCALYSVLGDSFKTDSENVNGGYPVLQWQPGDAAEVTLTGIRIAEAPAKTEYTEGESFDAAGMVVMAVYSDSSEKEINDYTVENGTALEAGMTSVTVKYGEFTAEQPITVTEKAVKAEYTLTMGEDKSVNAGETAAIPVTVGYTTDAVSAFNAVDMQFAYDALKLEFVSVTGGDYTVKSGNGTVRVQGYGADKALGTAFTLNFKALSSTDENGTPVTVTSAKVDESMNAVTLDAPEAKLLKNSTKITIAGVYSVTLPGGNLFTGADSVKHGEDYTFTATDKEHYDYGNVTATVGGETAAVKDNGDGTYTIENVTGDVVVSGTRKAKEYPITVDGNADWCIAVADRIPYGEDYTFMADNLETDKNDYTLTMTINGKPYTPEFEDLSFMGSYMYTIKGEDIVGDIHITFTQTEKAPATTQITFTGSGVADVKGGNPQTAATSKDFTFELTEDANYDYTVKAGGEVITGTDGKYTIPAAKITGTPLTVTVEKTFAVKNVNVQEYVKLSEQQSIWLVTVSGTAGDGKVFTYDNEPMYQSSKYAEGGTHAYLVIAKTLTKEEAAQKLGIANGSAAGTVDYSGDVNGSKVVDINDAQLVYDMYNAKYAEFGSVTMYKFLCADVSDTASEGATLLNVADAVAVVGLIK